MADRPGRFRGWGSVALGACLALGSTAPASAQQVGPPEVAQVRFLGNEAFPEDSLQRAIVSRPTDCRSFWLGPLCLFDVGFAMERFQLREREIPRDRVRLEIWYRQRGFREAMVDAEADTLPDGRARITFNIEEGRAVVVDSIGFSGLDQDDVNGLGPRLLAGLPLAQGDRLNSLRMDATRDTLIRRLRNQGYAYAEVYRQSLIPAETPYRARVTFDLEPGIRVRYGEITVEGTRTLDAATVIRMLQFRSGDYYRPDQLLDAQARLFGMDIVRSAQVNGALGSEPDSVVPITVSVQEGDTYRVRAAAGWTTAECMNVESSWTSRNFFGGARLLRARGRVSNLLTREFGDLLCNVPNRSDTYEDLTWLATLDFTQPFIFSTRNSLGASLFAERQAVPDIFIRRAFGLQLALTRSLGTATPLTLSYRPERTQLEAAEVLFCTGFLVCTPGDVAILAGANILAPAGLSFSRDRSNDVLNPTDGYRLSMDLEHAASWTGSDFRYDRVSAEGTTYASLGNVVVAARLRAGWVGSGGFDQLLRVQDGSGIVHPQKRFYAGGANSVRGFAQGRLGPRVLTLTDPGRLLAPRAPAGDEADMGAGCTPQEIDDLTCDASALPQSAFIPRPTGGSRVLEGNLELRRRLGRSFEMVAFGDFGQVWADDGELSLGDLEFTPGLGVRYFSPVGPIRIDFGYRFRGRTPLPVITPRLVEAEAGGCDGNGAGCIPYGDTFYVPSGELGILSPLVLYGEEGSGFQWSRFQLHFSIGQAF